MDKSVLIVDQEKIIRFMLKEVLTKFEFNVLTATSGKEALALIEGNRIPIYILELILADMEVDDLCNRIRKIVGGAVIFTMTRFALPFDYRKFALTRSNGLFFKPVDFKLMVRAIQQAYERLGLVDNSQQDLKTFEAIDKSENLVTAEQASIVNRQSLNNCNLMG